MADGNYINIYQTYLLKIINEKTTTNHNSPNIEIFLKLTEKLNSLNNKSKINLLESIVDKLYHKIENNDLFFEINYAMIKKFLKNQTIIKELDEKIMSEEFNEKKYTLDTDKFISWFLS